MCHKVKASYRQKQNIMYNFFMAICCSPICVKKRRSGIIATQLPDRRFSKFVVLWCDNYLSTNFTALASPPATAFTTYTPLA